MTGSCVLRVRALQMPPFTAGDARCATSRVPLVATGDTMDAVLDSLLSLGMPWWEFVLADEPD